MCGRRKCNLGILEWILKSIRGSKNLTVVGEPLTSIGFHCFEKQGFGAMPTVKNADINILLRVVEGESPF